MAHTGTFELTDSRSVPRLRPLYRIGSGLAGGKVCEPQAVPMSRSIPREVEPHPESYCHRCGGPNVAWYAPSPLWNEVMRGGDIDGPWQWNEIICPTCFVVLARDAGIATRFRVDATDVRVPLTLVTPSGRVWDSVIELWVDPA